MFFYSSIRFKKISRRFPKNVTTFLKNIETLFKNNGTFLAKHQVVFGDAVRCCLRDLFLSHILERIFQSLLNTRRDKSVVGAV